MQDSNQNTQQPAEAKKDDQKNDQARNDQARNAQQGQGQQNQARQNQGQQQDQQREQTFRGTSPADMSGAKNVQENRINQDDDIEADDSMHGQPQGSGSGQRQDDN